MSIDRLRYFAAVVETRNLRRAAELVGISPPSMSKAIGVLEQELGLKLLYPEGRGIGITAKGLEVYRLAASLLEAGEQQLERNLAVERGNKCREDLAHASGAQQLEQHITPDLRTFSQSAGRALFGNGGRLAGPGGRILAAVGDGVVCH